MYQTLPKNYLKKLSKNYLKKYGRAIASRLGADGGRAGRPRGRAEPREDDVRRRRARQPPGGARRRGRAGVDDDGAAKLDAAGRGRDEIDVVDRKVEDEQRNHSIYIGWDPLVPAGNTTGTKDPLVSTGNPNRD